HAARLFKVMFPDGAIAQKCVCKQSKTTVMISSMLATKFTEEPLEAAQEGPFTLHLDASSDAEDKLFPVLIRFCQGATGKIKTCLCATLALQISCIDQVFQQIRTVWTFPATISLLMFGRHRSLKVHIKNHASVYPFGCPCHLISLCASKAASSLSVTVGEALIWVFFYLDKSAKQKHLLKEHAEFVNVEHRKILKHSGTRWLPMGKCTEGILMIMPALGLFFQSEDLEKKQQTRNVCDLVCSPKTELYLLFVSFAITMFEDVNKLLQYEAPMINTAHGSMMELLRKVIIKFIRTEVLAEALSLLATNYSDVNNHVPYCDLFIGFATKQYLLRTVELTESQVTMFYSDVRDLFSTAVKYIVKKFPLNDPIHKFVSFLGYRHHQQYSLDNVVALIQHLPFQASACEMDELHEEFTMYQLLNIDATTMDSCREGGLLRPDILQHKTSKEQKKTQFPILTKLAKLVVTLPHISADVEHLFSMVKKNKTDLRSSLSAETLCSLLKVKINCFKATACY
uniref:HAT C-terminal dimerisation domain-containing protein n=1 Tax=Latimeria chalumnae TaxID=7897 RepID=H2ZS67_LATCH